MAGFDTFEMPKTLEMDETTATSRYAMFITEPWENGFGNTIGNALRRVLLTMLDGVAVSCIRIDGVKHEFSAIEGVMEDVMEIILNIKKLKFRCDGELPRTLELVATKPGDVTGADIREDGVAAVLNKDLKLCTLTKDFTEHPFRIEMDLERGRGYRPSERNKHDDQPIGSIPVDCLFSPIEKVRYFVRPCRVGEHTDYDRLELEVWTDERIEPKAAVLRAASILREHLSVFAEKDADGANAQNASGLSSDDLALVQKLAMNVSELELSVRSVNCLNGDNIHFVGELVQRSENQMLKCRNFGKKSLSEIKEKLDERGLSLGMTLKDNVMNELMRRQASQLQNTAKEQSK